MKERHWDILTGILVGGLIGAFYPLTAYVPLLAVVAAFLVVRLIGSR